MTRLRRLATLSGSLALACFGLTVVQTELPVSAATVTNDYCSANVTPSTGVSVSIADDGDCVVKFTSSTAVTWTRPAGVTSFELLVVGGGGGGGAHPFFDPGGGGGGGVVHVPSVTLSGSSYEVQVGAGGIGNNGALYNLPYFAGANGEDSLFGPASGSPLITAYGGGGGGGAYITMLSGGSGGGAHCGDSSPSATQGLVAGSITGAVLYGHEGGMSAGCDKGAGGGGGASERGEDGTITKAGDGGEGVALDVLGTGTPVVYASGGGGAGALAQDPSFYVAPGFGGTNAGDGFQGDGTPTAENKGVNGTGSGGGAQMCPQELPCTAGKGGDGVVIVRYAPVPVAPSNTAAPVVSGSPVVGSTLSVNTGVWSGTPRTYTYQWQRSSSVSGTFSAISGATSSTYVLNTADLNSYVRAVVTSTNAAGTATGTTVAAGPVTQPANAIPDTTTTVPTTQPQTTRIPRGSTASTSSTSSTVVTSTTTIPVTTTTAPPTFDAAAPPELAPGEAKVVVDGKATEMTLSRSNNQLIVAFGDYSSTLSAITADGSRRPLDTNGNVRIEQGDALELAATGFAADSDIEVWLFSTPTRLGVVRTDGSGAADTMLDVLSNPKPGNHRVVMSGVSQAGEKVVVAVGVIVGSPDSGTSAVSKFLIALPIVAAVVVALVIPTRRRRRIVGLG